MEGVDHMKNGKSGWLDIKKFFTSLILILLFIMMMGGCNGTGKRQASSAQESKTENEVKKVTENGITVMNAVMPSYEAAFYDAAGDGAKDFVHPKFYEGFIYYKFYDPEELVWRIDRMDAEELTMEPFIHPNNEMEVKDGKKRSICCFDVKVDGSILALVGLYETDENGMPMEAKEFYLTEYDQNGSWLRETALEEGINVASGLSSFEVSMGTDGDGNILVADEDAYLLSAQGTLLTEPLKGMGQNFHYMARTSEGSLVGCHQDNANDKRIKRINFKNGSVEELEELPFHIRGIGGISGQESKGSFIVWSNETAYAFDMDKKVLTPLAEWSAAGINGAEVFGVAILGDKILCSVGSNYLAVLSVPNEQELAERIELTLAVINGSAKLEDMVAEFNRSQKKYHVKISKYSDEYVSGTDAQDSANRMMMDVLGDDSPDLINLSPFLSSGIQPSLEDLVEKEYLEDLGPYLDRGAKVRRTDLEAKALELCSHQGILAAIPSAYLIRTMIFSSGELGDQMGWKAEDLIAYDTIHPDLSLVRNCSSSAVVSACITPNLSYFVDLENGKTFFDRPEFKMLMEYAKTYPYNDGIIFSGGENTLIAFANCDGIEDVRYELFRYFDGNGILKGFPSLDGEPLSFMQISSNSIALSICKRSSKKEGAWAFIEFAQEYELENYITYSTARVGIPVNKKIFEKVMDLLSDERSFDNSNTDSGYAGYVPQVMTEKEKDEIQRLIDTAVVQDPRMNVIKKIVIEEINPYLAGQKNLEQTIDVLKNRIELYLME